MSEFNIITKNMQIMELAKNSKACVMMENHMTL
jgi:hypothetical protein